MEFNNIKSLFEGVKETGKDKFMCLCPAHDDNKQSLQVWLDENYYIAMKCYANCSIDKILRSLRLEKKDLVTQNARRRYKEKKSSEYNTTTKANNSKNNSNQKSQHKPKTKLDIVEEYNYFNEDGNLVYQVVRLEPKDFRVRKIDASNGKWDYSLKNVQKVLYNLPNVVKGVKENKTIYIVEGEKDVNNINTLGLIGTTNVGGASSKLNDSKWLPEYNEYFKGADVVVLPDSDEAGFRHAYNIYSNLYKIAKSIKFGIFNETFLKEKFDVSDVIKHYNIKTKEELFSYYDLKDIKSFESYLEDLQLEHIIQSKEDLIPSNNFDDYEFLPAQPYGFCKKTGYRTYQVSDYGNATRVLHQIRDKVRYNISNDEWYIWNGSIWARDKHSRIHTLISQALDSLKYAKAIITENMEVVTNDKEIYKYYFRTMSIKGRNAIVKFLKQIEELTITQEQLDCNPNLFNLRNGTYDLKRKEFLPNNPTYFITKQAPIFFNEKATCNNWHSFLETIFADNYEEINYFQKICGTLLSGINYNEEFYIFFGNGKNGKSILVNVLLELFGDYAIKGNIETILEQKNPSKVNDDLAALQGARLVIFSEIPKNRNLKDNTIKEITGNEEINCRHLFSKSFTYKPQFKIMIFGNYKPKIKDSTNGLWRRLKLIKLGVEISNDIEIPSHQLLEIFRSEFAGIFNWIIEGYKRYIDEGLNPPISIQNNINEYKADSDIITDFLNEYCSLTKSKQTTGKDLYDKYIKYCDDNSIEKIPNRSFYGKLEEHGIQKTKSPNGNTLIFLGIELKS